MGPSPLLAFLLSSHTVFGLALSEGTEPHKPYLLNVLLSPLNAACSCPHLLFYKIYFCSSTPETMNRAVLWTSWNVTSNVTVK